MQFLYEGFNVAETPYTFSQLISFTRTSAATYVNSAGNIVTTPASKNLLTFTEEFDNAAWSKLGSGTGTAAVVTANFGSAPDGTFTADRVVLNKGAGTAASDFSGVQQTAPFAGTATGSLWIKTTDSSTKTVLLRLGTSTATVSVNGDWQRISVTEASASFFQLILRGTLGTSDSADLLLWGAQLELGSTATSYVRNFGGLFPPRFDYDPVTLQPRGLLIEEQRTNLLLRSEEFDNASWAKSLVTVTANYAVSPDGTADADRFVSPGGLYPQIWQPVHLTAGLAYTFSIWVKSDGTSQIQQAILLDGVAVYFTPTGTWTRISLTVPSSTGGSKSAVIATNSVSAPASSFLIWGAQLEAGSFATSYIPTVASQVTRTADQASIVAPNFASWYNQSEGTFVVEAEPYSASGSARLYAASAGSATNRIQSDAHINSHLVVWSGGVSQVNLDAGAFPSGVGRLASAYRVNDFAVSIGGSAPATSSSGSVPSVDRLFIGTNADGTISASGSIRIRRISYYPSRLSNAQLQALSA